MKRILLFTIGLIGSGSLSAQYRVALHHQGSTTIFGGSSAFIDAYNLSTNGDTIYLPGAQFSVPPLIDKQLKIFGAGIHSDSTQATLRTVLSTSLNIGPNADKLHIEGMVILGEIVFSYDEKIDSIVIRRNYFSNAVVHGTNTTNYCQGLIISENYMTGSINLQHATSAKVFNNVFQFLVNAHSNALISNNLMTYPGYGYCITNATETLFQNNAIQWGWGTNNVVNCTFMNNAIDQNPTGDLTNTWVGNFPSVSWTSLFQNFQLAASFETANYHLINPTSFIGTTGDQIGLYGGYSPIKDGALPVNPHISQKVIAPQTNAQGELPIQITVGAQTH